jgi:hypothetical protein
MKNFVSSLLATAASLLLIPLADATLYDRGNGLIYDDDLNITWLQDANLAATESFGVSDIGPGGIPPYPGPGGRMTWSTANDWIAAMNGANYLGYGDWRLPTALNQDGSGPCFSGPCPGSEMGHLYLTELGNAYVSEGGLLNTSFNSGGPGGPLDSFINLGPYEYWYGTEHAPGTAWYFFFDQGSQLYQDIDFDYYVWAVRDGDVSAVPEPVSVFLVGTGMAGVIALRRRLAA